MKIIYGKGECLIDYSQNYKHISIKYRGEVALKHLHREIIKISGKKIYITNKGKTSFLYHIGNKIDIVFMKDPVNITKLFEYNGTFRITNAKIDDKNISVETKNIDYWNLINSKWDSAGKPEQYKGQYFVGNIPKRRIVFKKRARGRLPTKTTTRRSGGGY